MAVTGSQDNLPLKIHLVLVFGSSEASGLTLRLEQCQDVALTDGSFDIAHEVPLGASVQENDLNLGDTTARSGLANDLLDFSVNNFSAIHDVFSVSMKEAQKLNNDNLGTPFH